MMMTKLLMRKEEKRAECLGIANKCHPLYLDSKHALQDRFRFTYLLRSQVVAPVLILSARTARENHPSHQPHSLLADSIIIPTRSSSFCWYRSSSAFATLYRFGWAYRQISLCVTSLFS